MLNRVDPLRRELQTLENKAESSRIKGEEINKIINELETSINKYKEEYALLISDANAIKADLETVEAKVQIGVCNHMIAVNSSLSGDLDWMKYGESSFLLHARLDMHYCQMLMCIVGSILPSFILCMYIYYV